MLGMAMLCSRARLLLVAGGQDRCSARRREAEEKEEEGEEAAAAVARTWGAEEEEEDDGRNNPWNASARTASRTSRHRLTSNRTPSTPGVAPPARRRGSMEGWYVNGWRLGGE
jgi:hypothetical protein